MSFKVFLEEVTTGAVVAATAACTAGELFINSPCLLSALNVFSGLVVGLTLSLLRRDRSSCMVYLPGVEEAPVYRCGEAAATVE
jgi:hypothetical protein